jgi:MFS family permease
MLATVLFINYIDRGAVSTAGPLIKHDLNLTNEQFGLLFSAFFWAYALIQIPVGWLAERYGAHRVLAAGLIIWSSATMLVGATSSFAMLIALRVMLGLGESAGFPCVSKLVAAVVPIKGLGNANGIVGFGYLIGPGVGIFAAGILIDHFGWRGSFVIFGLLSLLWLVPWSFVKLPKLATARSD